MPVQYKFLTAEQREHFLKHGWIKIPNAVNKKYIHEWMADLWVRLGWDEHDPTTWEGEYVKVPRHREVHVSEFAPDAYKAICDLAGGEERLDPVRNAWHGDQFIINNTTEYWKTHDCLPQERKGWHTDNDWYRQFLDSSNNALVIIHLFTDIAPRGGGTFLCEDGITGVLKAIYAHPEGLDSPFTDITMAHMKDCKVFAEVTGKAGDTFILHSYLPHTNSPNHLGTARVITNPHATLLEPFNLDRDDPSDYSLIEQVILDRMGRDRIPESEYKDPAVPRISYQSRNYQLRVVTVQEELDRWIAAAKAKGLGPESVDSVYLRGGKDLENMQIRFGLNLPPGPRHHVMG